MLERHIGFIGAGQMATALSPGLAQGRPDQPEKLIASDPRSEARDRFAQITGGQNHRRQPRSARRGGSRLPVGQTPAAGRGDAGAAGQNSPQQTLVVSIAAGIRLKTLAEGLGDQRAARAGDAQYAVSGRPGRERLLSRRTCHRRRRQTRRPAPLGRRRRRRGRGAAVGRRDRSVGLGAGLRLHDDRSAQRRRRPHGIAPADRHEVGRPDPSRRGRNGA